MNNITVKNILLDALIDIQRCEDAGTLDKGCGICGVVAAYTNQMVEEKIVEDRLTRAEQNQVMEHMRDLFHLWPSFSGDTSFPVPSCASDVEPEDVYYHYGERYALWDRDTAYGRLRWELLDWMAMTLRKDIAALESESDSPKGAKALIINTTNRSAT
jgi:hypothetical protein